MSGEEARLSLIYATESYIMQKVGLIEEEGKEARMGKMYFSKLMWDWKEFDFDHIKGRSDNSILNCQALCKYHHAKKTRLDTRRRDEHEKFLNSKKTKK